jgi:hypothetical protein
MLTLDETLYYYDEPLLATFRDETGALFIGVKVYDPKKEEFSEHDNPYLITDLLDSTYQQIINNQIKLHDAFLLGTKWRVYNYDHDDFFFTPVSLKKAQPHFPGKTYLSR